MLLDVWRTSLEASFANLWGEVSFFVPNLLVAIIIFLVGLVIGGFLGKIVAQIIRSIKVIDTALRHLKVEEVLNKGGFKMDAGAFLGGLVKWFVIIVFLVASFDVLGLTQVNDFLQQVVLLYLPQVIVAVLILLAAAVIADVMQRIVVGTAQAAGVNHANLLGTVTRWAIWIFAILTALFQLGIAAPLIRALFTGVVAALALGFGLSFGLGGQQAAGDFIERMRSEIRGKR
ncbi:MAG: hypothetical protein Q8P52_01625 [bacterium]|nr:hypothetical protein [bacterium]